MHDHDEIHWRKSSYSACDGNCVEVAMLACTVFIRDSKDPDQALDFPAFAWKGFINRLKGLSADQLRAM